MSKAFTKEEDGTTDVRLDDLPQSPHPNLVTPSGLADLRDRLAVRRSDLTQLKTNPEQIDRKLAIAVAERDIRFLETRIARAIVVDPLNHPDGIVAFGAEVDVVTEDDEQLSFWIVGEDQADPARGHITAHSPLGVALIGAELGSTVDWQKPSGSVALEVTAIRFP